MSSELLSPRRIADSESEAKRAYRVRISGMRPMFGIVAVAFDPVSARRVRASDPVACEPVLTNGADAAVAGALESLDPVTVQAAPEFWCHRIGLGPARLLWAIVTSPAAALRRPEVILNWLRGQRWPPHSGSSGVRLRWMRLTLEARRNTGAHGRSCVRVAARSAVWQRRVLRMVPPIA